MKYGELPALKLDEGTSVNGILIKIRNPPKTAVLRLPTTDEMLARMEEQNFTIAAVELHRGHLDLCLARFAAASVIQPWNRFLAEARFPSDQASLIIQ